MLLTALGPGPAPVPESKGAESVHPEGEPVCFSISAGVSSFPDKPPALPAVWQLRGR